jgi:hypothetical protein
VARSSNNVSLLPLKPWWVLVAFLSGMLVAMVAEDLVLDHRNHRLEFVVPHIDFFAGQPMARLRNAAEVPFVIRTTLWSGNRNHVFQSAVDKFVISYDIWEETYSVVEVRAPQKKMSHLTAKAAQAWCISQMSLDTTGLSGDETLWARLEIRAEDPPRDGGVLGSSVNSSGISLTNLIDIFSRPVGSQKPITLDYSAFTLDSLKRTHGS